jgi:hypothetical protein
MLHQQTILSTTFNYECSRQARFLLRGSSLPHTPLPDGNSARIHSGIVASSAVHSKMKINRGHGVRALVPTPILSEEGNELVNDCISKLIMVCLVRVVQICVIYLILDFCLAGSYGRLSARHIFLKFKRESMAMFQESTIQRCEPQPPRAKRKRQCNKSE